MGILTSAEALRATETLTLFVLLRAIRSHSLPAGGGLELRWICIGEGLRLGSQLAEFFNVAILPRGVLVVDWASFCVVYAESWWGERETVHADGCHPPVL